MSRHTTTNPETSHSSHHTTNHHPNRPQSMYHRSTIRLGNRSNLRSLRSLRSVRSNLFPFRSSLFLLQSIRGLLVWYALGQLLVQ